jgi:peptidyl-prolyl cis-trans isomerase A (cyclophilin A)
MNRLNVIVFLPLVLVACEEPPPEPEPPARAVAAPAPTAVASGAIDLTHRAAMTAAARPAPAPSQRKIAAKPVADVKPSPDDPLGGKFSLADATKGLTGKGPLIAEIKTAKGTLSCTLYEDKAPLTVANFVGLARGLRPWKTPQGKWEKKPGYDGTTFHRVVKGFMIQGGDPAGTGSGEPGYVIPDEVWEDALHDQRGLLCMANRGPNTNGMQFFVTDGVAAHLDGGYTIFGKCEPETVVEALANSPVQGERAVPPPKIEKVSIKRLAKPAAAPAAAASGAPSPAPAPSAK